MGWSVEQAIQATKALADFDVFWLEEPTIPDDLAGHIKIMREGALPIATGENFHTLYEFQHFITAGAVSLSRAGPCDLRGNQRLDESGAARRSP